MVVFACDNEGVQSSTNRLFQDAGPKRLKQPHMIGDRSYWSLLEAAVLAYGTEKSGHIGWICLLLLASVFYQTLESLFAILNLEFLILDRGLRFSIVLFCTIFVVLKSRELVLMISESSFGGTSFCSLFFNFSAPQVMTSAVGIAESLVLFSDSTFSLSNPFVCSLDFF